MTLQKRTVFMAVAIVTLAIIAAVLALRTGPVSAEPAQQVIDRLAVLRESAPPSAKLDKAISATKSATDVVAVDRDNARELSGGMSLVPVTKSRPKGGDAAGLCLVKGDTIGCRADEDVARLSFMEVSNVGDQTTTTFVGVAPDGASQARFVSSDGKQGKPVDVVRNSYVLSVTEPKSTRVFKGPDGTPISGLATPAIGDVQLLSSDGAVVASEG